MSNLHLNRVEGRPLSRHLVRVINPPVILLTNQLLNLLPSPVAVLQRILVIPARPVSSTVSRKASLEMSLDVPTACRDIHALVDVLCPNHALLAHMPVSTAPVLVLLALAVLTLLQTEPRRATLVPVATRVLVYLRHPLCA